MVPGVSNERRQEAGGVLGRVDLGAFAVREYVQSASCRRRWAVVRLDADLTGDSGLSWMPSADRRGLDARVGQPQLRGTHHGGDGAKGRCDFPEGGRLERGGRGLGAAARWGQARGDAGFHAQAGLLPQAGGRASGRAPVVAENAHFLPRFLRRNRGLSDPFDRFLIAENDELSGIFDNRIAPTLEFREKGVAAKVSLHIANLPPYNSTALRGLVGKQASEELVRFDWTA